MVSATRVWLPVRAGQPFDSLTVPEPCSGEPTQQEKDTKMVVLAPPASTRLATATPIANRNRDTETSSPKDQHMLTMMTIALDSRVTQSETTYSMSTITRDVGPLSLALVIGSLP